MNGESQNADLVDSDNKLTVSVVLSAGGAYTPSELSRLLRIRRGVRSDPIVTAPGASTQACRSRIINGSAQLGVDLASSTDTCYYATADRAYWIRR